MNRIVVAGIAASLAACGGDHPLPIATDSAPVYSDGGVAARAFRGDGSRMPSWGGWSSDPLPAEAVARAGFDWFETGYPGDARTNQILADAGVRPFAYVNATQLEDGLSDAAAYSGPILRDSGERWNLHSVDVTHPSWKDWLVHRADEAYRTGSRGIKWDAGDPELPAGKTRADVNDAYASVMQRIRDLHPDMKFVFNQAFAFASAYPQYIDGMQTEGLFSVASFPSAYLKPWDDPFYWGPQFQTMKSLHDRGIPILVAEYADPFSDRARELYDAITAQGFVPYITSERWNLRGRGLNVNPGW